jgi:transcriptional regulator
MKEKIIDLTQRQNIIIMLKEGPVSFMNIANKLGVTSKDLMEDVESISKSFKLKTERAKCKKCDFEFRTDHKFHTPSRCPSCRSEWIESQKFWIVEKGITNETNQTQL